MGLVFLCFIYPTISQRERDSGISGGRNLLCFVLGISGGFSQRISGSLLFKGGTTQCLRKRFFKALVLPRLWFFALVLRFFSVSLVI